MLSFECINISYITDIYLCHRNRQYSATTTGKQGLNLM